MSISSGDELTCPICQLINPASASRCDCGYDFEARAMARSFLVGSSRGGTVVVMAPVGVRFLHFVVDMFLARCAALLVLRVLGVTSEAASWMVAIVVVVAYYVAFETLLQRTPAKFATRTRVVMLDGQRPDVGTILLRTLWRFVPFEPLFGITSSVWWHDHYSNTAVKLDRTIRLEAEARLAAPAVEKARDAPG